MVCVKSARKCPKNDTPKRKRRFHLDNMMTKKVKLLVSKTFEMGGYTNVILNVYLHK